MSLLVCPTSSAPVARRRLWLQLTANVNDGSLLVPRRMDAALYLGQGAELGRASGFARTSNGIEPVSELQLVGPGMETIQLTAPEANRYQIQPVADFSRVESALGDSWSRFSQLHFAVIGAGRLGSAVASILARDGGRRFTLIDPDTFEAHNLAGGVTGRASDVGSDKVMSLARSLRKVNRICQVEEISASVTHWRSLEGIAAADLLISAADHDSARLATGALAALFHLPLLDVGTGIFREHDRREMGSDLRLTWPGRCLIDAGGLRDGGSAFRALESAEAERLLRSSPVDWRRQRAGSLASLNAAAAGVAARMIEDFVAGLLIENGAWTRLQFENDGRLRVTHPQPAMPATGECLCVFAGLGGDGLDSVLRWLKNRTISEEDIGSA